MTTKRLIWAAGVALAASLSACGSASPEAESRSASISTAPLPTESGRTPSTVTRPPDAPVSPGTVTKPPSPPVRIPPSLPPRDPTDKIKNTAWVVGTVTTGGSGPCYGLLTDDGTQYALYASDGTTLVTGTRMRIRTQTAKVRIGCSPGKLVEMTAAEPVR